MKTKVGLSVLAGVVLIFAATACDISPSAPFVEEGQQQGATQQGATLNGQIQQSGVAAVSQQSVGLGYNAQRSLATAAVTATAVIAYDADSYEIGRVDIDADGSFTIRGLPEYFTLIFVDANEYTLGEPMEFDGVKPNQEIDIVVAIDDDGDVVLLEESRTGINHEGSSGIEIDGTAQNIVIDSPPNMMTGSLYVNEYHVLTRAGETSIRKGQESLTLEDIKGKQVHVRGVFEGDDVFAFEIKLQEEEEDDVTPQSTCTSWDPDKPAKIRVCHSGKTLSISPDAWPEHSAHGDTCGPC